MPFTSDGLLTFSLGQCLGYKWMDPDPGTAKAEPAASVQLHGSMQAWSLVRGNLSSSPGSCFLDDEPGGRPAEEPRARHRVPAGLRAPHCLGPGPASPEGYLCCHPQLPRGVPHPAPAECAPGGPTQPQARRLRWVLRSQPPSWSSRDVCGPHHACVHLIPCTHPVYMHVPPIPSHPFIHS